MSVIERLPEQEAEFFSERPDFPTKTVVFTMFIGAFFGYLNETLLNVALSTLMLEFAVEKTTVQWVSTGFLLVMGAFTPITANVIQWFSTRAMLMITLALFLTGSLTAAFAPVFEVLLLGRVVQAVSAAFTVPVLFNTVLLIYPPHKRGTVMGLVTMMFVVAPALGPTLSGLIVDYLGWRYLFLFTVPFIVLAMVLAMLFLKTNLQTVSKPKIDVLSALLSVFGFGGLVYAASNFALLGARDALLMAGCALVLLYWFVRRQRALAVPLIDLRVLSHAQFRAAVWVLSGYMFVFIGAELVVPMYLQQAALLSATLTGLVLLPGSVLQAVLSPVAGNLLDRKGVRGLARVGTLMLLAAFVLMLLVFGRHTPVWAMTVIFALLPASAALLMVTETHGLNALPKPMYPHGTAILTTINPIAGALGAAFFVGIMQIGEGVSPQQGADALMDGVQWALSAGLAVSLWVGMGVLRLKNAPRG